MRYFLVTFFRKPGGQIDEQVLVSKRCKPADYQTCNLIMDFATRKVEKCVIEGKRPDRTFDDLANYYRKVYPVLIEQLEKEAPITLKQKTGK
jgi:hypothetical protein